MRVFITVCILFPFVALGQTKRSSEFSVIFTEFFKGDTVSLSINGKIVVKNVVVTSGTVGKAGLDVVQKSNGMSVYKGGVESRLSRIQYRGTLNVLTSVNSKQVRYTFNPKKGKVLLIGYNSYGSHEINLSQTDRAL